jgi:hypothetical protein
LRKALVAEIEASAQRQTTREERQNIAAQVNAAVAKLGPAPKLPAAYALQDELDTVRQQFAEPEGATRASAPRVERTYTPDNAQQGAVQELLEQLAQKDLVPEDHALLEQLRGAVDTPADLPIFDLKNEYGQERGINPLQNYPSAERRSDRRTSLDAIGEWAHALSIGQKPDSSEVKEVLRRVQSDTAPLPTGNPYSRKNGPVAENVMYGRSEQHAYQQDMFPDSELTGTTFATQQEFEDYLASDALHEMRQAMHTGKEALVPTISRLLKKMAPLQARRDELQQSLENMQGLLKTAKIVRAEKLERLKAANTAALQKYDTAQAALTQKLEDASPLYKKLQGEEARLRVAEERLERTIAATEKQIQAAEIEFLQADLQLGKAVKLLNRRMAMYTTNTSLLGTSPAVKKAAVEASSATQAYETARSADDTAFDSILKLHKKMMQATQQLQTAQREEDSARFGNDGAATDFLNAVLKMQMQLGAAEAAVQQAQARRQSAKDSLDAAHAAREEAQRAVAAAEADKAAVEAEINAVRERNNARRKELPEAKPLRYAKGVVSRTAGALASETETSLQRTQADMADIARIDAEVQKVNAEIDAELAPLRARMAQRSKKTAEKSAAGPALNELPGSVVSFENRRAFLDRLESLPEQIKALQTKADDETLSKTARNDAKRKAAMLRMSLGDALDLLSNDPENVAAAQSRIDALLEAAIERRDAKRETLYEPGVKAATLRERKKALREIQREVKWLETLRKGAELRPEIEAVLTPAEKQAAQEEAQRFQVLQDMVRARRGDEAETLSARRIGPVVRGVQTGIGKVRQAGQPRGVSGTQAQRSAAADTEVEQRMLRVSYLEDLQEKAEAALEEAFAKEDVDRADKVSNHMDRIKAELEKAQAKLDAAITKTNKGRDAIIEEDALLSAVREEERTPVSAEVEEALRRGALGEALDLLVTDASMTPEVKRAAAMLAPFVRKTKVRVENDVRSDGEPVEGMYLPTQNTVVLDSQGLSVEALLHEVSHAATLYTLTADPATLTPAQRAAVADLQNLYSKIRRHPDFSEEYGSKDLREFVSEIYSNPGLRAKLNAVGTPKTLWQRIKEAFARLWGRAKGATVSETAMQDVERLMQQSRAFNGLNVASVQRKADFGEASDTALAELADKVVASGKPKAGWPGADAAKLAFEMKAVDMRAGVDAALRVAAKDSGNDTHWQQAMYMLRKADQKNVLAYAAMSNGALEMYTDAKGLHGIRTNGGANLKDVFEAVSDIPGGNAQGKMALASMYMIAQRAANKGLSKMDLGGLGVTQADMDAAMKSVAANPELKRSLEKVRELYNEYNSGMLKFLGDTGAISKKLASELLADGDYVPYYRVNENGLAQLHLGGDRVITIGDVRHQPYLRALEGGNDKVLPLNESLMRNTMLLTDKAMTNLAARNVAYALRSYGAGQILPGQGEAAPDVIHFTQEPTDKDDDGKRWIKVRTAGTAMEGVPPDVVVRSLEGAPVMQTGLLKLGAAAGDLLRSGVTRTPLYLARQLLRDPMAASATTGLDKGPVAAVFSATKEFIAQTRGRSETAAKLAEKGLIQSGIFSGDADDVSKFALQLASGKDASALDRLFAKADKLALQADAATRALVYENAIKNGLSEVEADFAVMESMNFHKRGLSPSVQHMARMIPFFNSQIQGLNVLYKAATGQMPYNERLKIKTQFYNRAMILFVAGLAYAASMEDDDEFRDAKPRDRYSNFFVPLGEGVTLKVPLPYEFGSGIFGAAVALMDSMREDVTNEEQGKALLELFKGSVPGGSSNFVPQIFKPVLEAYTNKSMLNGLPIESRAMEGKTPDERFNAGTTELAKAISKAAPILSPVQIEHLVRGYLGQIPIALMGLTNDLFAADEKVERPTRRLNETPVLGGAFQTPFGGAAVEEAYRIADRAKAAKSTLQKIQDEGRGEAAQEYHDSHADDLRLADPSARFTQRMGEISKNEKQVQASKMSADEKRQMLDELAKARRSAAKMFLSMARQPVPA